MSNIKCLKLVRHETNPLYIALEGPFKGWLLERHPDGQLVTLRELEECDVPLIDRRGERRAAPSPRTG